MRYGEKKSVWSALFFFFFRPHHGEVIWVVLSLLVYTHAHPQLAVARTSARPRVIGGGLRASIVYLGRENRRVHPVIDLSLRY